MRVNFNNQDKFPVNSDEIKKRLEYFLNGKAADYNQLELSLVSEQEMLKLGKKFLNENNSIHDVLSFPSKETKTKFVYPPKHASLGEIVVCYNKAVEEAHIEKKSTQEKVYELAKHGVMHLLGHHH